MSELAVCEFLSTLPKSETVHYRANPGNAGDALIASGAYKLLEDAGLKFEMVDPNTFDAKGKTVIYAGGGNLVGIYPEAREFFLRFHRNAGRLILLPHTVAGNEDLLEALGGNVTLFARERISYGHLRKYAEKAEVFIDHDLALHLDPDDFLNRPIAGLPKAIVKKLRYKYLDREISGTVPQPRLMLRNSLFELRTTGLGRTAVGNFFREDIEASGKGIPEGNADLSKIYEHGTRNRYLTDYTTSRLLRYIDKFPLVRTDRLHICIAAALLGKEVEFYPNSYFKCRAVYEYSLRSRFPRIKWLP
jgi:exopolysaccharide biosynthesis predicted pyruvyltransferase EpsI